MYFGQSAKSTLESLTVYRSSAGSGKTRTLAKAYLKLALAQGKDYMKHILAVTFTNRATKEMKERIIEYLDDFSNDRKNNLTDEICKELGMDRKALQQRSQEVLSAILHEYSQFAISTIDAFFQRVIRSFTREAGLLGNFRLEVDNDIVMDEVIASLLDEVGSEPDLTEWITQFSKASLEEGENWNITRKIKDFSGEITKEQFKRIEEDVLRATPERHKLIRAALHKEEKAFYKAMKELADQALAIMRAKGITKDDFSHGDTGTAYKYFMEFASERYTDHTKPRIQSALASANEWAPKKSLNRQVLTDLAATQLIPILKKMTLQNHLGFHTAEAVLKNYYSYGLISDITRKLKSYKEDNNVMLLSDATKFLNGIINESDTPFIYEKVGTYFHHYLMDEFQDTSNLQWKNFIPLLREAWDQGNANLIVGDVKQSIYRFRGGDLELLQHEVANEFGADRIDWQVLNRNYRSEEAIVTFNNTFFAAASEQAAKVVSSPLPAEVYHDVVQEAVKTDAPGYVEINFLDRDEEQWKDKVLGQLPGLFEKFQDLGVALSDVAILVRKNDEGQEVAKHMLQFQNSKEAKKGYRYDVVSNESLRLDNAFSVGVLIAALKFLNNPNDDIARGQLAYETSAGVHLDTLFVKAKENKLNDALPEAFLRRQAQLKRLSLFELTEELIRIFELGVHKRELAYLQAFQDIILEFSAREKTDLSSFLDWWEMYKAKKSIKVSGNVPAANILTLHVAKGLQFKYVIVPFCNWTMSHEIKSNLLWVSSAEKPFNEIGPVPVPHSSSMEKTLFRDDYEKEKTKLFLDNLNLLYVAFTRAESGLMAFAPRPSEAKEKISFINDLLYRVISEGSAFSDNWNGSKYQTGNLNKPGESKRDSIQAIQMDRYASCDWRKKLVIKREGSEFFNDTISEKRTRINHGIVIHKILSLISYKTEAQAVLDGFFLERAMLPEEREAITKSVMSIMEHPVIGQWFTKDWEVMTEQLILLRSLNN